MPINVQAIERNGVNYVPLKETVEQMGGEVRWDNLSKSASVTVKQATAMLDANANTITVNGRVLPLSSAPHLEDGKLYVTYDTLEAMGITVG
jgi:hypothetical protein